jgi:hypothetical protein
VLQSRRLLICGRQYANDYLRKLSTVILRLIPNEAFTTIDLAKKDYLSIREPPQALILVRQTSLRSS